MTFCWSLLAAIAFLQPPAGKSEAPAPSVNAAKGPDASKTKEATKTGEPQEKEAGKTAEQLAAEFDKDVPTVVKLRSIAAEPYRIRIWLTIADHPRVTPGLRQGVIDEIEAASDRYLGSAWTIDYGTPPADAPISPDAPPEDMPDVKKLGPEYAKVDKVLWADVSVEPGRAGVPPFIVTVREYDAEFNKWGPAVQRVLAPDDPLPVNVFRLLHRQFRAIVGVIGIGGEPGKKTLRVVVKGAALQSPDSPFPVLPPGSPLKLTKEFALKKGTILKRFDIPYTYLIYRTSDPDRRAATCDLLSSFPSPVDNSMLRRSKIMGLAASNTEDAETEVSFFSYTTDNMPGDPPGKRPVPGYEVLVRIQDTVTPVVAGATDRRGRITLSSSKLDPTGQNRPRVCEITLRIGRIPVANFPLVPGDEPRREVPVNADPLLPEVSGRVGALQEEIVDTLARQAILLKRLDNLTKAVNKKLAEGDNDKVLEAKHQQVASEINSLPGNDYFQKKLEEIKADAKKRSEKEFKQKSLGKFVTRLFAGVEELLKKKSFTYKVNVKKDSESSTEKAPSGGAPK